AGLLAKVTFPAVTIAAVILVLWRLISDRSAILAARAIISLTLPTLLLAAPFYIRNFRTIVETTEYLSSASVASVFGLGGGMSLVPSLRFLGSMLLQYEFLICAILASAFALWCLTHGTRSIIGLAIVALSSVIPFLIVALSNFKLERYAYP